MSSSPKTAFITGGSSGIGFALSTHLLAKDYHIFIADLETSGAQTLASQHNTPTTTKIHYAKTDVSSWSSQLSAFQAALKVLGRIDFVAPIAGVGERKWIPNAKEMQEMGEGEFREPNLTVVDVDLKGLMYTVGLAIQQFRRQEEDANGSRGKIGCVASICGLYAVPTLPIYTAAKHGVIGLVRTYGKLLPDEAITMNAVCPNIVRTGISTSAFYEKVEREGLLVNMKGLLDAFDDMLDSKASGDAYECGPKGGFVKRDGPEYLDQETERSCELVLERASPLHY
ncbi:NAD(P)-binding protein [Pleomassaria siparia CBS 279.74]|uniref:NAD(P)-binding protein n=1 Tax=Pleomassaria siparia CBS 279.74 TaxID=1314801 RepID=A0A6G1KP41_9PLEO|nr:NAD(P)-binding protein [Pleomassaria siparia CBS 279.74]